MQTNENELTIRTAVDAAAYITGKEVPLISQKANISEVNVRAALAGRAKKSKANGIIIEYGRMKQAEARKMAEEIFKTKK